MAGLRGGVYDDCPIWICIAALNQARVARIILRTLVTFQASHSLAKMAFRLSTVACMLLVLPVAFTFPTLWVAEKNGCGAHPTGPGEQLSTEPKAGR